MRSDIVDLFVAFVLGAVCATAAILGWAYDSARRKGKLERPQEDDE